MKTHHAPARRATWLLIAAPALLATPAVAQEAVAPPPVTQTVPPAAPDPAASKTTIAPGAADVVDEARIEAQQEARAERQSRQARQAPARRAAAPAVPSRATAPVATAPAAVATPVAAPPAPPPPAATAPAEPAGPAAATETTTTEQTTVDPSSGFPLWPLLLVAGLLLVGAVGYRMWSRRRDHAYDERYEEAYVEPAYAEPDDVEPVAAAPVQAPEPVYTPVAPVAAAAMVAATAHADDATAHADDATVSDAGAEDVAALTDADAPVTDRPWLEFAMRPVRMGTSDDEAVVEIELTVANAGSMPAEDVRVSAFMLADVRGTDMESLLIDRPSEAAVDAVTIRPGEGTRIDATLATAKADVGAAHFRPVVVADARYRLPDGSEGRTSASFMVGVTQGDGIGPIALDEAGMRDNVEARLHGEPQHA